MRFIIKTWILVIFAINSVHATSLKDLDGNTVDVNSFRGKWVFINYWASWCKTCVEEIPELNRFYAKYKQKIFLYGVNYDHFSLNQQQRLIKDLHITYPSLKKDPASLLNLGDIPGVPVTFIINPKGQLSTTLYGGQNVRSLERVMNS